MQVISWSGKKWIRSLVALTAFLSTGLHLAADEDAKPALLSSPVQEAVLKRLRQLCVDELELRGIFIAKGVDQKKGQSQSLILHGFLDKRLQGRLLAEKAEDLLAKVPAWSAQYPAGIDTTAMRILPIRSKHLPMLKEDFAKDFWADRETRELLAQTRLDDVFYRAEAKVAMEVVFTGVCIYRGADKPGQKEGVAWGHERLAKAISQLLDEYGVTGTKQDRVKVDSSAVRLLRNPLPLFQERFTRTLYKDDIFFQAARYAPCGTLLLKGWVGKSLGEHLPNLFKEQFSNHASVACPEPKFSLEGMKHGWRLHASKWNSSLSNDADSHFQRTHLERLSMGYSEKEMPQLRCEAFRFFQDPDFNEQAFKEKLRDRLAKEWERDWPELKDLLRSNIVVTDLKHQDLRVALQRAMIQKLGVKDAFIENVWYDPEGVYRVEGRVGNKDSLEDYLKKSVFHASPKRLYSLERVRVEKWQEQLKTLQGTLRYSSNSVFRETRLDEIFFGYSEKDSLEIRFSGVCFHPDFEESRSKVAEYLLKNCYLMWPTLKERIRGLISIQGIRVIPRPDVELQARINEHPALDGVVFKERAAFFDTEGKLVLPGYWRTRDQEESLRDFAGSILGKMLQRPDKRGLVFSMEELGTDILLKDLRKYAAEKLEDVRLDRLYFDKAGKLRLEGFVGSPDDEKALKDELRRLVEFLPKGHLLKDKVAASANIRVQLASLASQPEGPGPGQLYVRPRLAKHLREKVLVPADRRWDGALVARGFYGQDGKYYLSGLVDSKEQTDLLEAVLKELAALPEWRTPLGKGWSLESLRVMPLAPMLEALRQTMPEYESLDGLRLARAYHTPGKSLVLTGFSIRDKVDDAALLLEQLLAEHPLWNARVKYSETPRRLELKVEKVARNEKTARLAREKALRLLIDHLPDSLGLVERRDVGVACVGCATVLVVRTPTFKTSSRYSPKYPPKAVLDEATRYLDVTLFHLPQDSTAWFLRGACYLAAGNRFSAARDLRRMNRIESKLADARDERAISLEHLQGDLRMNTSYLADQVLIDAAFGISRLTLMETAASLRQ